MKALMYCIALVLLIVGQAHAKDTPNGKPFIALEEQIAATNAAIDATNEAVEATNEAVDATNEALAASDAATNASIQALNAADAALEARDDILQSQINLLNLTLTDQLAIINNRFEELKNQIDAVDVQSQDADKLMAEKIELHMVAIDLLSGQVESQELLNTYQSDLIDSLFIRVDSLDTSVEANQLSALQQYQTIANQISSILNDTSTSSQIALLQSQLNTAKSNIATLSRTLGRECAEGFYVAGVQTNGNLLCREASDIVVVSQPLTKTRTCVSDSFLGCLDYEYWQFGTAYCPGGYKRTATTNFAPGGTSVLSNNYSYAYLRTSRTDSELTSTGYIKVTCSNSPLYEYTLY